MKVSCRYYSLKENKLMQDGNFIFAKQKLLYICTEENLMQFETVDESDIKKIFWASFNEITFLEEIEENWSEDKIEQQQKETNGIWLIN